MSFFCSQIKFDSEYIILVDKLKNVNYDTDLIMNFQQNLMFSSHIDQICSKAIRNLGFLTRNSKELTYKVSLKTLVEIVRILSITWILLRIIAFNANRFGWITRMCSKKIFKIHWQQTSTYYWWSFSILISIPLTTIQESLYLECLDKRRRRINICFMSIASRPIW